MSNEFRTIDLNSTELEANAKTVKFGLSFYMTSFLFSVFIFKRKQSLLAIYCFEKNNAISSKYILGELPDREKELSGPKTNGSNPICFLYFKMKHQVV